MGREPPIGQLGLGRPLGWEVGRLRGGKGQVHLPIGICTSPEDL